MTIGSDVFLAALAVTSLFEPSMAEQTDVELRRELEAHVSKCSKCYVIRYAIRRVIKVYVGMQPQEIPEIVHVPLMMAAERKIAARKPSAGA